MTLNKINVKNFQSIHSGEVELGKFTVFTGPSSSGKSALMRAAQAIARNSFTPSMVRQGSKETHVSLEFDNHTVEAIRGKSKSTYVLDGKEFTKAGRQVPEPVEEALRLPLIAETESTFSTQFDKPYLIAEPGSVAAKVLGSLTNVSVLHNGLKESNRRVLETNSQVKTLKASLEENEEALKEFEFLDEQRAHLDRANEVLDKVKQANSSMETLQRIILDVEKGLEQLRALKNSRINIEPAMESFIELDELADSASHMCSIVQEVDTLEDTLPRWNYRDVPTEGFPSNLDGLGTLNGHVESVQKLHGKLPQWNYAAVDNIPSNDQMDEAFNEVELINRTLEAVYSTAAELRSIRSDMETVSQQISDTEEEYDSILSNDFKECPLCGTSLHEKENH